MRKKIGLAAALLHDPQLLVLDEPFEAVDPVSAAHDPDDPPAHSSARGGTVVFSSHVMALVERLCDARGDPRPAASVAAGHAGRASAAGVSLDDGLRDTRGRPGRWRQGLASLGVLIRLKLRLLVHALRGGQATFMELGGLIGALLAARLLFVGFDAGADPAAAFTTFAIVAAVLLIGWLLVSTTGGGDPLRPEFFALLPIGPRRLAFGLLVASFVGVLPVVSLLAFGGLVVAAAGGAFRRGADRNSGDRAGGGGHQPAGEDRRWWHGAGGRVEGWESRSRASRRACSSR